MRSKKAQISWVMENLGGLLLAALVIVGLVFFVASILGLVTDRSEDQTAIDNFEALTLVINQLVEAKAATVTEEGKEITIVPGEENKVQVIVPYFLPLKYALVGFDEEEIGNTCGRPEGSVGRKIKRPEQCTALPCLCLAVQDVYDFTSYLACKELKNAVYLSVTPSSANNYGELHGKGVAGNDLVIRSKCRAGPEFGVKNIKIIKEPSSETGKFNLLFNIQ